MQQLKPGFSSSTNSIWAYDFLDNAGAGLAAADPAVYEYMDGIKAAVSLQQQSWKPATTLLREKWAGELEGFLKGLPTAANKNMATCTPMDICVFCTKAWLPKHAGVSVRYSNAAGEQVEEKIAAPQSLASMIAHLSTHFKNVGRLGEWQAGHRQGNPCQHPLVSQCLEGYGREAAAKGYRVSSAVPLTEEKVTAVGEYLLQHIRKIQGCWTHVGSCRFTTDAGNHPSSAAMHVLGQHYPALALV